MKPLRNFLDKIEPHFEKGGKLEKLYPVFEGVDTFLYTPGKVTESCSHVRDGIDLKRMMSMVIFALVPTILMAIYNSGLQANLAYDPSKQPEMWQTWLMVQTGLGFEGFWSHVVHGLFLFVPVMLVSYAVGGFWEGLFSTVRKHDINEGFFVTGMLFPLTLPPTIPLWQVALGISFGVVIGKEIFGGTGMNILNPALVGRAFLFFAYPAQISGDSVWIGVAKENLVDGVTGATPLMEAALNGMQAIDITWTQAFLGFMPGSMGETSALACLIGAVFLILTGIGSWKIMLSCLVGMIGLSLILNGTAEFSDNPMLHMPAHWHLVVGGYAFGLVYMATDPVSASMTNLGKYIYGFGIGILVVIVRALNPAFPEGMMLSILFMNVFAPLIDYYVLQANIKRRRLRSAT